MSAAELYDVPSVVESILPRSVELPAAGPPAPWKVRAEVTVWGGRGVKGVAGVLPEGLAHRRSLALTTAGLLRCLDSPVGPYRELWASPVVVWSRGPRLHVPFIAVDSPGSVRSGRELWALPKTVAAFDADQVTGPGWRVEVASVARGPELPVWWRMPGVQVRADGTLTYFRTRITGRVRVCRVRLVAEGPTLQHWLPSGSRWGLHGELTLRLGTAKDHRSAARKVSQRDTSPES